MERSEPEYAPLNAVLWHAVIRARMPSLSTPSRRDGVTRAAVAAARRAAAQETARQVAAQFPSVRDSVTADVAAIQQDHWFRGSVAAEVIQHWIRAGNVQQKLKSWRESDWLRRRGSGPQMHAGDLCAILIALALVASDDADRRSRPGYGVFRDPPPAVRWWAWATDGTVVDPLTMPVGTTLISPWAGFRWLIPAITWQIRPTPPPPPATPA